MQNPDDFFPVVVSSNLKRSKRQQQRQQQNNNNPAKNRPGGGQGRPGGPGGGRPGGKPAGGGSGGGPGGGGKVTKFPNASRIMTGSRMSTPSTTPTTPANQLLDESEERTDLEPFEDYLIDFETMGYEKSPFWNVTCINRTYDENFKNFQKGVNRNVSTIHVPTQVYKQEIIVNMTSYWTEALNEQFKKNYEGDNELFWQYFCSSIGLFRRYPGAYWTVPQYEDYFDCRLQSWYIMAAASAKDVLILLDVSGSMTGTRFVIAKKLFEAILDTLSDNDFFNVLVFSKTVDYLMNMQNETQYRNRFIQAGKTNKQTFINRLKWFYNTSDIANFDDALKMSFGLLLKQQNEGNMKKNAKIIVFYFFLLQRSKWFCL
jgi:hypothetical protein